ncbi:unnamed protein product [Cylindrotheca closterium]|uniref:Uncharacterized protein n=1 Tax=Cylindrotheca closterium TaxID=2856 RepID=A0AAD2PUP7_9STRA|nr:unnamed protein product [Cylindrotheca closterium]
MIPLLQILVILLLLASKADARSTSNDDPSSSSSSSSSFSIKLPPWEQYSDLDGEEDSNRSGLFGHGREFKVFGSSSSSSSSASGGGDYDTYRGGGGGGGGGYYRSNAAKSQKRDFVEMYRRYGLPEYGSGSRRGANINSNNNNNINNNINWKPPSVFRGVHHWWRTSVGPKLENLPRIVCRVEPTTTLKLRKTVRPLGTIVQMGADFNTQLGVWQFKSSWEEPIIGGKLTLIGNELHITKSWRLYVGAVEDLVTRLRFRAAINLQTFQAYARVGFRTERLSPINVMEGFTILKRLPLDGSGGNVKLEVKANVALPEPEIEYSTETQQRSLIGMGDVEVSIDEMNLLLDY